jgi:hypothetical protein
MNPADPRGISADEPLDETDHSILDQIQQAFRAADPMPAGLPDRIRLALALRDLEVEIARLTAVEDQPLLTARGEEHSQTITFESDSLTIMIRIDANKDGTARIDGWLAPPQACEVQIKGSGHPLTVPADEHGRFAFPAVPRGTAQLVIRPTGPAAGSGGRTVVTPALLL